ncbi:MAG TPA: transcription elongation factor GreA [Candidatus Paceibacterota bacterium]
MSSDQGLQYFSKAGLAKLKEEIEYCKTAVRQEIAQRLEYAKSLGDLSENSEYQEAKESQMLNESRIAELEATLRSAIVVEKSTASDAVQIGSQVTIEAIDSGAHTSFFIVGANEASPAEQKISHESPLGQALLQHTKGDTIEVHTPKGSVRYKIMEIV